FDFVCMVVLLSLRPGSCFGLMGEFGRSASRSGRWDCGPALSKKTFARDTLTVEPADSAVRLRMVAQEEIRYPSPYAKSFRSVQNTNRTTDCWIEPVPFRSVVTAGNVSRKV